MTTVGERIAALSEVPTDSTLLFRVSDDGEEREVVLARAPAGETAPGGGGDGDGDGDTDAGRPAPMDTDESPVSVVAWLNQCQHFTHIPLDKGSGAPVRGDEVVCANHGAMFALDTGRCTFGPCEGAYLTGVDVAIDDGDVVLADQAYDYLGRGPAADDGDLTSTSNVEF